jgi:SAM-dependent methyltransferase
MAIPDWVRDHLACPGCTTPLASALTLGRCSGCSFVFPIPSSTLIDLRGGGDQDARWRARQEFMEREYDLLLDDGDHAARAFEIDYRNIAGILRECSGRILDVGGGIGITREWLPSEADYLLLEPSAMWADSRWLAWTDRFPCLKRPPVHVRAFAESLPFLSNTFDVVLHLWTLNHVIDARRGVREGLRVLRRGGRLIAVLEEMPRSWSDVWNAAGTTLGKRARAVTDKVTAIIRPAPLQADHIAVRETVLTKGAGARVISRAWTGPYLTFILEAE